MALTLGEMPWLGKVGLARIGDQEFQSPRAADGKVTTSTLGQASSDQRWLLLLTVGPCVAGLSVTARGRVPKPTTGLEPHLRGKQGMTWALGL